MTNLTPLLPKIDPLAYLRTAVPVWWGSLLAFLAAQIPAVADFFAFIDEQVGEGWRQLAGFIAAAAVIYAYYWVARQIGRRWPAAEKWLIGSSSQPVYVAPEVAAAIPVLEALNEADEAAAAQSVPFGEPWSPEERAAQNTRDAYVDSEKAKRDGETTPPWSDAS